MKRISLLYILVLAAVVHPYSDAQNSGKVSGTVSDASSGEPLIGATIIVEGTSYGAAADAEGNFIILKLPSGTYTISANSLGYAKTVMKNVEVLNDLTTTIGFRLSQSAIALKEEVVVFAESPMVRKDLTSTEARVTADVIKNLPLQNLDQLITQQAGVSKDAGGGIHIRGGRSTEVSYLLNGVSMTDDYSRSQSLTVETSSIQELQVISGTFNAEYGNAMSGVVNVVTKSGGSKFHSELELWTGDYASSHTDVFWGIGNVSPGANYNLQGSVSGPILSDRLTYFLAGRRSYNGGYLYGMNQFTPVGRNIPGDNALVPMNSDDRWSGQATVEWQMSGNLKIKTDVLSSWEGSRFYTHLFKLNPNGEKGGVSEGTSAITKLTHQIFATTFQELTVAYKYNDYTSRLYNSPYDSRYVHPDSLIVPGYHFSTGGTDVNRFQRSTESVIAKWDVTSQIDKHHLVKAGVEAQRDNLFYENMTLVAAKNAGGQDLVPFVPAIPGIDLPNHDRFDRGPFKYAVYVQDKIEMESMIINFGLRFESFDPRGRVPRDKADPNIFNPFKLEHIYKDVNGDGEIGLNEQIEANKYTLKEREAFWYTNASVKTQISPRVGVAYPITDKGIIRFSYGIFQQIPEYSQLYLGDQFKLTSVQDIQGVVNDRNVQIPFGNNDLRPQRTTIYEIGLQQQFHEDYAMDVTAFYRDIRDWISSTPAIQTAQAGVLYSERTNRDFANVRGVTLSFNKRFSRNFSFGVDYTYQVAEGTNSSPDDEFFAQANGSEPKRILSPLSWDQTHTLNANLYVSDGDWGGSLIGSLISGQPYTPTLLQGANTGASILAGLPDNSLRKPTLINLDLEAYRNFKIAELNVQLFIRVFNLLDAKNPLNVYTDTGKPDYTTEERTVSGYDPGWFVNPSFYSEPRSVYLGTRISL